MKIEELRIGNYVNYFENDTIFKVIQIESNGLEVKNDKELTWIETESFEGVPITEEWMLKFGFEKNHKHGIENYVFNNFTYYPSNKQVKIYDRFGGSLYVENIEFVHQLQNLYFTVNQKEL